MIHVTFCSSGAGTLREVLRAKGLHQRVVDLTDELSWGPIATDGLADRQAWLDRHAPLGFGLWDWIPESTDRFRKAVAADSDRLIWIAPHSADEQAGLYWYLDNFDASDAQMIIADYPVRTDGPLRSFGELDESRMTELFENCPRTAWDSSRFPANHWQGLVADHALLRVVKDGMLQSAPDDFFDNFVLTQCSQQWRKLGRVIGDTMIGTWDAGHFPNSFLLTWRMRELILRGEIECEGPISALNMDSGATKVRLVS